MTWDVFVEWNEYYKTRSEIEENIELRADFRSAVIARNLYQSVHQAASRVISAVSQMLGGDGKIDFDYEKLPDIYDFMPFMQRPEEVIDVYDYRPLDPENMTQSQWEDMFQDVELWQNYLIGGR